MDADDLAYFEQRVAAELDAARKSTNPAATGVHYKLASHYIERLQNGAPRQSSRPIGKGH